ncbi:MAG TPA: alkaline phosphatase D family protein [Candidatus Acidoferrales bacterium]|nr:alkaline phosphatase D family protein [Candidatus Acidoferrales bacterium]
MKTSRREFLRLGLGAAAVALASRLPARAAEPAPGALAETGLSHGCTVGDVTADSAVVWLRAPEQAEAAVHYGLDASLTDFRTAAAAPLCGENDFTANLRLTGLRPGTVYYYRAAVAGKRPGPVGRFVTAPAAEEAVDVRFAFSGDSRESYQPFVIMDAIREMRPDFFLHLGDTIYADREWIATRLSQFWNKYATNRADLPTQRLFSQASVYVMWDDHEVADNCDHSNPLAPIGRRAFFDYWPLSRSPLEPDRLYRSYRWGKAVELFILDTRQYRDRAEPTILGKAQREWFLESLAASTAWFKIVASSVPFSSPQRDKWGGFRAERERVLAHIAQKQIRGVIFLAADVHYAAVCRVPGAGPLREFVAGPIGGPMGLALGRGKRFEFFYRKSSSYGLVKVRAEAAAPYVEIDLMDARNNLLYRSRIDAG